MKKRKYEDGEGQKIAAQKVRDLLKRLDISEEKIPDELSARLFYDNGAASLLSIAYNSSTIRAIEAAYPGKFKPWQFKRKPKGIWQGGNAYKNAAEATRWLVEEKLKISLKKASKKVTRDVFTEYGLSGMLDTLFGGNPYRALVNAYPKLYKVSDVQKTEKRGIESTEISDDDKEFIIKRFEPLAKYLASKYLHQTKSLKYDDLVQMGRIGVYFAVRDLGLTKKNFKRFSRQIKYYIINTVRDAINKGYDRILDFSCSVDDYVFENNKKRSLVEIITEKHKELFGERILTSKERNLRFYGILERGLSKEEYEKLKEEIAKTITRLETRMANISWDPMDEALEFVRKYAPRHKNTQKWELGKRTNLWGGGAGRRLAKQAIRYLFEEKLKIPEETIPEVTSSRLFHDNGLGGMLLQLYDGMSFLAVSDAYPNKFKPWEFKNRPHLWGTKDGMKYAAEATRWLVEEKLGIPPNEALKKVKAQDFKDYRLWGMLMTLFKGDGGYHHAILNAYPELVQADQPTGDINPHIRKSNNSYR